MSGTTGVGLVPVPDARCGACRLICVRMRVAAVRSTMLNVLVDAGSGLGRSLCAT